jgi:hypothetical protein
VTQADLFTKRIAPADLPAQLVNALRFGMWRHREDLARTLGVSVRQIREAAHDCKGQVLSSQDGLKLTVCATSAELDAAIGRARSQVSEMTNRIVQTLAVWEARAEEKSA